MAISFSDAELEYLYTTRKRLAELPKQRIVPVQTAPAAALVQVQAALADAPDAVHDAVLGFLKAVNELCDGALRKAGRVNLSAVEAAQEGFAVLATQLQLGLEDSDTYLRALRNARAEARQLDVAAIEATLQERASARANKDFATADRLQRELLDRGVVLLDHAQGSDWTLRDELSSPNR